MIILFGAVILDPVYKGHRIQHKMIVQVIFFVKVGCNNHLITVTPQTGGELHSDLVRRFGRDLAGSKGLIPVVGHRPVLLAEPLFYRKHFVAGGSGRAVDTRHKAVERCAVLAVRFLRFLRINGVADHIGKLLTVLFGQLPVGVEFRVCGLFGVLRIDHHLAEPAFHTPD